MPLQSDSNPVSTIAAAGPATGTKEPGGHMMRAANVGSGRGVGGDGVTVAAVTAAANLRMCPPPRATAAGSAARAAEAEVTDPDDGGGGGGGSPAQPYHDGGDGARQGQPDQGWHGFLPGERAVALKEMGTENIQKYSSNNKVQTTGGGKRLYRML
jgi:hypothetical protein